MSLRKREEVQEVLPRSLSVRGVLKRAKPESERVQRWRERHGGRGKRIPAALWAAAAEVARAEGVEGTARALRLRADRLAAFVAKLETEAEGEAPASEAHGAFIDLGPLSTSGKTVVELMSRRGDRMRIDVTGASSLDIAGLAQAFLREP